MTGEELPDTAAQSEFARAEDVPSESETRGNQVIIAWCQRAIRPNRAAGTRRTFVYRTGGQKGTIASRAPERGHIELGTEARTIVRSVLYGRCERPAYSRFQCQARAGLPALANLELQVPP